MGADPQPAALSAEQIEHPPVLDAFRKRNLCLRRKLKIQPVKSLHRRRLKPAAVTAFPI
jgi:hypothetical protein